MDGLPFKSNQRKAQSPARIQRIYACLRAIFNPAVRARWLRQSPKAEAARIAAFVQAIAIVRYLSFRPVWKARR